MDRAKDMGVRRFGRWNTLGLATLAERECRRFMSIWSQTVMGPLINAGLLLAVFAIAIGPTRGDVMGVSYVEFIAPGLLMMTVIQNAFANTSSSLLAAKVQGNIIDTLMPPLSPVEMLLGYLAGALARGLLVAVVIAAVMIVVIGTGMAHPLWFLAFVVMGALFMGALGILAGIYASKFDQMSAITNFIITPLSFLSGTFYSIEALPEPLQAVAHIDPFFYLIDGARYGTLGVSDTSPVLGLAVCSAATLALCALAWRWFRAGYRMKS
ncbi:ABC-2 type transport system permease protein [Palleronia aestuarii]|uniref:Transport permease protein n=1 Tax=Palleronia aestuarii TaxID=568105 RepID=A0A2W7NX39_9RHOB|nr:ABC transporter permease [Palleronia aestuarii]PZX15802.1 ABC-2 type transport system permease protein [Palleronia aestuarii]